MDQYINPEMLILGRESRGYTQTRLAERTSLSQANISKYEQRVLTISDTHLQAIASALSYPDEFFLRTSRRYGFGTGCTYHRRRQTMPVHELRTLLAQINIRRMEIEGLLEGVDIEIENKFVRLDLEENGYDPEDVAHLVRSLWDLPIGPIRNLVEAIENAGGIVFTYDFGTNKLDAISQIVPGTPPLFFVNSQSPADRLRFTLAHEIGHVFMHRLPPIDMKDQERQADEFAAAFLMPREDISKHLATVTLAQLAKLKPYWRVSMAALARRAHDIGMITSWHYRTIFEDLSKSGYRLNEPLSIAHETPTVLADIVNVYINESGYSVSELSRISLLGEAEFRNLYRLKSSPNSLRLVE